VAQWLTRWYLGPEVLSLRYPSPVTILLGNDHGQVDHSHCLSSVLNSKKLGYKREYLDWTDL